LFFANGLANPPTELWLTLPGAVDGGGGGADGDGTGAGAAFGAEYACRGAPAPRIA
jgi:hypothetical protein